MILKLFGSLSVTLARSGAGSEAANEESGDEEGIDEPPVIAAE